ncbi:MAG: hypothetical protein HRU09_15940 [Oligoflexales bacterium]|nr:hypothetical protein [Oligoflexales bacterium]
MLILLNILIPSARAERFNATGKDHGKLSEEHEQASEEFFSSKLKTNGEFDEKKIKSFLDHLKYEKKVVVKDVYETILFEKLAIDVKKYKKSKEKANEKSGPEGPIIRGYNEYLIPKIERLHKLVSEKKDRHLWQGLVNDFARAYITYFIPNGHRTIWPEDVDIPHIGKRLLTPYKFSKEDKDGIEAFNLRTSNGNILPIRACLGLHIPINHYLNPDQLKKLIECGYDISKIDPGVSAFWERRHEYDEQEDEEPEYFPKDEDRIIFKRVNFRSRLSEKIKTKFKNKRNGKTYDLKIKMGQESHTDYAVSKLLEQIGMHQDRVQYRKHVRVYLEDDSVDEFFSAFASKYRIESVARFIKAHGVEEGTGIEWIEIKDVLLEGRPEGEVRVAPFDVGSWDLQNRREYRSLILLLGWMGVHDLHPGNCKLIFKETEKGLLPLHRFHDPASSLGGPMYLKKPNQIFSLGSIYRVNAFASSFIGLNKDEDTVKLHWNDFANRRRNFKNTSWYDLKWMARNIASIDKDTILKILLDSGMPLPVAKIYYFKLLLRRNEIIKAFDLSDEFPPDDVPDLKELNLKDEDGDVIKKGKVVKTYFKDKNDPVQIAANWWTVLPALITFDIPVQDWRIEQSSESGSTGLAGLEGVKQDLNIANFSRMSTKFPVGLGITAIATRKVEPNFHIMGANDKIHLHQITDSIQLQVGIDSPLLRKLIKKLPVIEGDFKLSLYIKEFRHIHYEDEVGKAYFSKFDLFKIIANINHYAAFKLEPLEVIHSFDKVGFEIEGGVGGYSTDPIVNNELSFLGGTRKITSNYLLRDQYGQLHYYKDNDNRSFGGMAIDVGTIDLFALNLPLFNLKLGASRFSYHMQDYVMKLPEQDRDKAEDLLTEARRAKEYLALKDLNKAVVKIDSSELADLNYSVDAKGTAYTTGLGFLFFLNKLSAKLKVSSEVTLPDGEKKYFYRVSRTDNRHLGIERLELGVSAFDLLVKNRKRTRIELEMDEDEGENFVMVIRTEDFYRSRKLEKVNALIHDLNRRYSFDQRNEFYDNFILPDKEQVRKYPKVYALTRTFLFGKQMKKVFADFSDDEIKAIARSHFTNDWYFTPGEPAKIKELHKKFALKSMVKKVLGFYRKIREAYSQDPGREKNRLVAKYLVKLTRALKTYVYGLHFFRETLGKEGMFVIGEITGLLRSYSALNDLMQLQRRRFMAKSWGTYKDRPPLQKFLRKQRLVPPSGHIDKTNPDNGIFGGVETGVPPNLDPLYNHNDHF